jgi:hypothetical protein
MNKKGSELSMNVIIIAAIGLLVLLVLSFIFLGRVGTFGEKSGSCDIQGGICAVKCGNADYGTENNKLANNNLNCPDNNAGDKQICCLPIKIG